jgi:hypothetical protein
VIVDAHAHIVVRAAAAGAGRAGSWRPQVTEVAGRSRIQHDGRELTSAVREFTDPGRMAAEAAAQGIGHVLLSPWVRLLPFDQPLAEAREICQVQNDALTALVAADPGRFSALGAVPLQDPATASRDLRALLGWPSGLGWPDSLARELFGMVNGAKSVAQISRTQKARHHRGTPGQTNAAGRPAAATYATGADPGVQAPRPPHRVRRRKAAPGRRRTGPGSSTRDPRRLRSRIPRPPLAALA